MHDMLAEPLAADLAADLDAQRPATRLGLAKPGERGVIVRVTAETDADDHGIDPAELQRRLLEFGFVEGAAVEVLHQGLIGADPIAVRVDDMRIALRRRDANHVWLAAEPQ